MVVDSPEGAEAVVDGHGAGAELRALVAACQARQDEPGGVEIALGARWVQRNIMSYFARLCDSAGN